MKRPGSGAGSLFWFGVSGLVPHALIGLAIRLFVSDVVTLEDAIRQDLLDSPFRIFGLSSFPQCWRPFAKR
jgi:hypothetical protein